MTKEELYQLLQSDESYRIERTVSTSNMDKFQEAICAFSNDLPGTGKKGYLLIGVKDNGDIAGLKVDDDLMKRISGIRSDGNILPLPVMNTEKVETEEGDVLVVEVTPSFSTPVRYRGRTFVRIGPRKDIASADEERILTERNLSQLSTFDVMPCREATLEDIDTEEIRNKYLPLAIDSEVLDNDRRDFKEQMASLRLYNRRYDCPTMAAVVVFGRQPKYFLPGCYIQYVRFEGLTKAGKIINEKEFKGGLATLLPRLDTFLEDAVVMKRPEVVSILREKTITNYPGEALRELLMNACMHRDYQSNTPIRLYQFDDRIEIMNAGGLYGEARPENFPNVNAYRNPIIAEAMKVMKYVNMFNRGVSRVQEYLEENGSQPAVFNVDKLTVFEVVVKDANATDLERSCYELRTNLESHGKEYVDMLKRLIFSLKETDGSANEIQLRMNSARTPHELRMNSARAFMKNILKPAIAMKLVEPLYPDSPHHPKQKYRLTDMGKAMMNVWSTETIKKEMGI